MERIASGVKDSLFEKGDLHDCRISDVLWSLKSNRLLVSIIDLNANFAGLPEYSGPQPGCLVFDGVQSVRVDVAPESDRIYEASFRVDEGVQAVELTFSPAGKFVVHAEKVSIKESGDE